MHWNKIMNKDEFAQGGRDKTNKKEIIDQRRVYLIEAHISQSSVAIV